MYSSTWGNWKDVVLVPGILRQAPLKDIKYEDKKELLRFLRSVPRVAEERPTIEELVLIPG